MPQDQFPVKPVTQAQLKHFRQAAEELIKEPNISQLAALGQIARREGFSNWKAVLKASDRTNSIAESPSGFADSADVQMSQMDLEGLEKEKQEKLANDDKSLIVKNRKILASLGIEYSIFEPTATGLEKSILDATQPVRTHFQFTKFHDYRTQGQGGAHKVIRNAFFVSSDQLKPARMSMYRPKAKNGDPRMWFTGLGKFAPAESQVAIVIYNNCAHLINLTNTDLEASLESNDAIDNFLKTYESAQGTVSSELLAKLKEIAKKPLPALGKGDTAIGMAIEAALGIEANSSKKPDYKGIELKSARSNTNRKTLFAQVADWSISACKSSREILEAYGYERDGAFKLYCTISTKKVNSQGLIFEYSEKTDLLTEKHKSGSEVATWTGDLLRSRLQEKHAETFWIHADSKYIDDIEHFYLKSIVHTKAPILNQLMPLIHSGIITMDHLIKRTGGAKPKVSEKGPLFKIEPASLPLLFPTPVEYSLLEDN